ncbi:MAG: hypothetical protein U0625_00125 [Phycisphaerales bacterium]
MPTPDERTGLTSEEHRNRALLSFVGCLVSAAMLGQTLADGQIGLGRRGDAFIRPETSPLAYWGVVAGLGAAAIVAMIFGVMEWRASRRTYFTPGWRPGQPTTAAMAVPPKGFRRGTSREGQPTIAYRASGIGCLGGFFAMWLAAWTYGCVLFTSEALHMQDGPSAMQVILLTGAWMSELLVIGIVVSTFGALTTFTFHADRLEIERSLLGMRRVRSVPRQEIQCVRQVEDPRRPRDLLATWSLMVEGTRPVALLSSQPFGKSAWLGPIVAQWAGVGFEGCG